MFTTVDVQAQSRLFIAPTEIRQAIYAYLVPDRVHLICYNGTFRLVSCAQRADDDDPDCTSRDWCDSSLRLKSRHPLYARRLQLPWGEH